MAIIDVDRHILLELTGFVAEIKRLNGNFDCYWGQIIEVRDKTDALIFYSSPSKKRKEQLWKLRNKIFKATERGDRNIKRANTYVAKLEALLLHLVSEIKTLDTGKGLETDENWRRNKEAEQKEGAKKVRTLNEKPDWERTHVKGKGKGRYFERNPRQDSKDRRGKR